MDSYYDALAPGYDELHKEEQLRKLVILLEKLKITQADRVLDVGCATAFSFECLPPGCRFQGVEPSRGLIAQSRHRDKILCCKAEELPYPDRFFTVVLSVTALQNFDDPRRGLEQMRRVGSDRFGISFLKKSPKRELLETLIKELFVVEEQVEEPHDLLFICRSPRARSP